MDTDCLPVLAAVELDEIDDRIRRQDSDDDLEKAFEPLLNNVRSLLSFATAIRGAQREIESQVDYLGEDAGDDELVRDIVRAESTCIERLKARDWPWEQPAKAVSDAQMLADHCRIATLALGDVDSDGKPTAPNVLSLFRQGNFEAAAAQYQEPPGSEPAPGGETSPVKRQLRRGFGYFRPTFASAFHRRRGGVVPWMTRRPRTFAGAASVVVVAIVGLQLRYLGSETFSGDLGDWLALVLWAIVVELSGVSVLDVLGRLGNSNVRPAFAGSGSLGNGHTKPAR